MKKLITYALIAAVVAPSVLRAQEARTEGLKEELVRVKSVVAAQSQTSDKGAQAASVESVQAQVAAQPQSVTQVVNIPSSTQIVPAQTVAAVQVQPAASNTNIIATQPTQTVEAAPVNESRADRLRKAREQVETQTELKIVEKLEQDRLSEEQKRADKLFGDRLNPQPEAAAVQAPQQAVVVAPVVQQAQPAVVAPVQAQPPVDVKSEVQSAISELEAKRVARENEEKNKNKTQMFMSIIGGTADYNTVTNVKSKLSAGFGVGAVLGEGLVVEANYIFSRFDITNVNTFYSPYYAAPTITMEQNNVSGAVKYQLLEGKLHPVIGGLVSYNNRKYTDNSNYFGATRKSVSTDSVDVGVLGGVDLELSKSIAVGGEIRYMTNLNNNSSDLRNAYSYNTYYSNPVEELNYYMFLINGRISF